MQGVHISAEDRSHVLLCPLTCKSGATLDNWGSDSILIHWLSGLTWEEETGLSLNWAQSSALWSVAGSILLRSKVRILVLSERDQRGLPLTPLWMYWGLCWGAKLRLLLTPSFKQKARAEPLRFLHRHQAAPSTPGPPLPKARLSPYLFPITHTEYGNICSAHRDHLEGIGGIYLESCEKNTNFFFICFKYAMKKIKLGEMSKY